MSTYKSRAQVERVSKSFGDPRSLYFEQFSQALKHFFFIEFLESRLLISKTFQEYTPGDLQGETIVSQTHSFFSYSYQGGTIECDPDRRDTPSSLQSTVEHSAATMRMDPKINYDKGK